MLVLVFAGRRLPGRQSGGRQAMPPSCAALEPNPHLNTIRTGTYRSPRPVLPLLLSCVVHRSTTDWRRLYGTSTEWVPSLAAGRSTSYCISLACHTTIYCFGVKAYSMAAILCLSMAHFFSVVRYFSSITPSYSTRGQHLHIYL